MTKQLITISRLRAYRSCPRYHHLFYDMRLEPVHEDEESATRFGTAGHAALEAWLGAIRDGAPEADVLDAAHTAGLVAAEREGLDVFEAERLAAVVDGYHLRWYGAELEIVAVEAQFRAPLRNPATGAASRLFDWGGKIDGVVRDRRDGRLLIMEHKFTSQDVSPGSTYWQRLRIDGQVSIYLDGAAALGYVVDGCLYDVIAKPQLKPLRATPEGSRRYTRGKGCKLCGGKRVEAGTGTRQSGEPCAACDGSGWEEAPRLDARQRDRDETPEEFGERVRDVIGESPDRFFGRAVVVRLPGELEESRWDVWQTAQQIRESQASGHHPRNTDACARMYGRTCPFLPICCGEADLATDLRYRVREHTHTELNI